MPPPARPVPEEVVEEILLRVPPHKPACLVRASIVSKPWLALLSGARFRDRYREFHGAAPMLGFLRSRPWDFLLLKEEPKEGDPDVPPFVSTTKFRPRIPDAGWGNRDYTVLDCRHGRVLLAEKNAAQMKLAVWDPMTGHRRELEEPGCMVVKHVEGHLGAAVLCAVTGCDHRACHQGPFRVVFFSLHYDDARHFVAQACVSLPETGDDYSKPRSDFHRGEWSEPCTGLPIDPAGFIEPKHPVLWKDALYFTLAYDYEDYGEIYEDAVRAHILKYDLVSNCLSLIDAPSAASVFGNSILMAMEDGRLGFAHIKRLRLHILSSQIGSDGVATWTRSRVINLKNIPPIIDPKKYISLLGSVEGSHILFVYTEAGIYKINLKTLRRKKIWEGEHFHVLIPYMSFYNPRERVSPCDAAH